MRRYLRAFFVGSSFPVIIWPFLYFGISFTLNPITSFSMALAPLALPVILGLANVVYIFSEVQWPSKFSNKRLWLFGGTYGLLLSLHGNFVTNLPVELFRLSGYFQYLTIPFAVFAYALIWRYIMKHLNKLVKISK